MCALRYEVKLWIVNDKDEAVFGNGLAELLETIDKHHSLLEAAENLDMSYRYALHRISLAENVLGGNFGYQGSVVALRAAVRRSY
jgi:molybdenum-dependent DNA-binding transcriptional regulator ModE